MIRICIALGLAFLAAACSQNNENQLQGWVEADLIFVSPDEAGRVDTLNVREGDTVNQGAALFTVDPDLQQADVVAAEASLTSAQQAHDRAKQLLQTASGTQRALDDADAALRSAQARLNSARTRLNRRRMVSPVTGTIQQVYYRPGETVPAGRPVLSILPPENLKIRFFAPQRKLQSIKIDDTVAVSCDGCEPNLTARVSFIAQSAEYTPPVIYSLEERSKLVYLIEARPDRPDKFRVGQPVTVTLPEDRK
jgi:HlyD family secretion protein